ncbi:CCA tRNA nucleotidyltransferase [Tsuneonella sp. YG55]|uniref:CCA tRNA nucleotidyltransferase n=1 Tax=Tsuneonella litorea TaxID=2976475 RepID=A0A9X2W251_9SPHN|nr:CCA tRNA nucleotidyltransferase [Tsuneonella litorea]MCT2558565.1 CCA tRNA nucleotidyltransferase [Tsuneonella litorea]
MADLAPPRVPDAEWTRRPALARLVGALGEGNVRWVGGAVRDTLLGQDVHDIDAATPLEPVEVIDRLEAAGIRTIPTGIDHGTVTAILDGGNVEITTLRHDVSTDGRRATVAFASDWKDDAARRDFTINALYAHPSTREVFDYFGGVADLEAKRVRFIGDARQRIREDYLRILRYFRFQARFGSALDAEAEEACAELAESLKGLSRERVGWELQNLLALPDPGPTVARMRELGVLQVVLPEAGKQEVDKLSRLVAVENAAGVRPHAMRRLAALLPAVPPVAEGVAARLRLSKNQRARLTCTAARDTRDGDSPRALAYAVGVDCAIDRLLLEGQDIDALKRWEPPVLPVKGGEIVARGVRAGPEVARILRAVERRWVDEGFPDRERVAAILEDELARRG